MALETSAEQPAPVRQAVAAHRGLDRAARRGVGRGPGRAAHPAPRAARWSSSPCATPSAERQRHGHLPAPVLDAVQPPLVEGARVVVHAKPELLRRPRHPVAGRPARSARSGSASCSPASSSARPCWPPRACSRPSASGRCRSCRAWSGSSAGAGRPPSATSSRTPGGAGRPSSSASRGRRAGREGRHRGDRRDAAARRATPRSTSSSWPAAAARSRTCCRSPTRGWCARSAACRTPVVSAIGHEQDSPLLDLVADVRASTPTDAARRVVPDVVEERDRITHARRRLHTAVDGRLAAEARLAAVDAFTALCSPTRRPGSPSVATSSRAGRAVLAGRRRAVAHAIDDVAHIRARVRALSPRRPSTAGTPWCSAAPTAPWCAIRPRPRRARPSGCGWPAASWRPCPSPGPATRPLPAAAHRLPACRRRPPTRPPASSRPATSSPRSSAGSRPAARRWRSRCAVGARRGPRHDLPGVARRRQGPPRRRAGSPPVGGRRRVARGGVSRPAVTRPAAQARPSPRCRRPPASSPGTPRPAPGGTHPDSPSAGRSGR